MWHFSGLVCVLSECVSVFRFVFFFPFEQPFFPHPTPLKLYCTSKGKPAKNARTLLLLWLPSKMGVPVQHGSFLSSPLPQCCTWCSDGFNTAYIFCEVSVGSCIWRVRSACFCFLFSRFPRTDLYIYKYILVGMSLVLNPFFLDDNGHNCGCYLQCVYRKATCVHGG